MAPTGEFGSAGVGSGSYKFRGQCVFFNSDNNECCSTKAAWREAGTDMDSSYCEDKLGSRADNWDNKWRSWRLKNSTFEASGAWPVTSRGRRLGQTRPAGADPDLQPHVHEFQYPNGTSFWVVEDVLLDEAGAVPTSEVTSVVGLLMGWWQDALRMIAGALGRRVTTYPAPVNPW